jgi:thiol:disulfide interchange protein DsbC
MLKFLLLMLLTISCAYADEAAIRDRLQKNYPQLGEINQVNKSPLPGLYEVVTPDHLFYTDEQTQYLIDGSLYDLKTMRNITDERARKLFAVDFKSLPFDLAMKKVKGNGKRQMLVFTDPNCGFCKKLEAELQQVTNVTIYRVLYPIFPGSEEKARAVWCSKDKNKAWEDMMLRGVMPAAANCNAPLAKTLEWGHKLKVNGTPTLIFADGTIVPGYLPAADLEKALDGAPGTK